MKKILLLTFAALLFFPGCEQFISDDDAAKFIGRVRDINGYAVKDVKIFLVYNFDEVTGPARPEKNYPQKTTLVTLDTFYAVPAAGNRVTLHWITSAEIWNTGFGIQRKINDVFTTIGFVAGSGTTDSTHSYSYTTDMGYDESFVFRLKIIQSDGVIEYSYELIVPGAAITGSSYFAQNYPNPFSCQSNFSFVLRKSSYINFDIFNFRGDLIIPSVITDSLEAGNYNYEKDLSDIIPSGGYKIVMKIDEAGDSLYSFERNFIRTYCCLDSAIIYDMPNMISSNGIFEILYADLPVGLEYVKTSETEPLAAGISKVNNKIKFIIYKPGYKILEQDILIENNQLIDRTFVLVKE